MLGTSYATIAFHPERCDGCGDCMTACARVYAASDDPSDAVIQVLAPAADGAEPALALCRQCGDPKCVMDCPAAALTKNAATGTVDWDGGKCVDCLLCTAACAYGGIELSPRTGRVAKCDTCAGDPACVPACPHGALEYVTASASIYNRVGALEDQFVPGLAACQGCNSELLIRHTMRRVGKNAVVAAPPGCIPGMGTVGFNGKTGAKVPIFHPLLTNTASMLAGIKRQYQRAGRDVLMVALAGDGGAGDVGFQSLSGAAERREPMLFVCVDNEGYMNTGMQSSGSTTYGSWTSTTPVGPGLRGKRSDAKSLPLIMAGHDCDYVATASLAFMDDYYAKLDRAIAAAEHGLAYLHVYSPCPTGWRIPAARTIEACRKAVTTNFVQLWEFTPESGLRFTHPVDDPEPVTDYLRMMGKFRHVDEAQLAHIQARIENQVARLRGLAQPAPETDARLH